MPNGGVLPCCGVCRHGAPEPGLEARSCALHTLTLHAPMDTFCSDLEHPGTPGPLAPNLREGQRESGPPQMYGWLTLIYREPRNPTLPMYYHEYRALAALDEYRAWTAEQARARLRALTQELERDVDRRSDADRAHAAQPRSRPTRWHWLRTLGQQIKRIIRR